MDSLLKNATNTTAAPQGLGYFPPVITILAWIALLPFALLGNGFVIRTVFTVSAMKTPTNILFVNLAICDIITALTLIPSTMVVTIFRGSQKWFPGMFGIVTCKTIIFLGNTTIAGSIVALTLMAIDRYFAICCPLKRVTFFKRYKLVTALVWLASSLIMLPTAIWGDILPDTRSSDGGFVCRVIWPVSLDAHAAFMMYVFVLSYLLPLVIMALLYGLIAKQLWSIKIPTDFIQDKSRKRQKDKRKIVVMLLVVLAVFAVCWLPVQIVHISIAIKKTLSPNFQHFAIWLGHANSAINPCLYIALHSGFKKAFLQCFYRCGLKQPVQDENHEMNRLAKSNKRLTTTTKL